MDVVIFEELYALVEPEIIQKETRMTSEISPEV